MKKKRELTYDIIMIQYEYFKFFKITYQKKQNYDYDFEIQIWNINDYLKNKKV